jgi:hypothetical protein
MKLRLSESDREVNHLDHQTVLAAIFGRKYGNSLDLLRSSNLCGGLLTTAWHSNKTLAGVEFDWILDIRCVSISMRMVVIVF